MPLPARSLALRCALAGAAAVAGCTPPGEQPCEGDLMFDAMPDTVVLVVGDTATWRARQWECNGRRPVALAPRWATSDAAVVAVEPGTGRVTARRPGWATVTATDAARGRLVETRVAVVW